MLDAANPKFKDQFDAMGMPVELRQDYLRDMTGLVGQILDGYFAELRDAGRQPAETTVGPTGPPEAADSGPDGLPIPQSRQ
jgi:hypothetical protein